MSYRDPAQSLEQPLADLLSAIEALSKAVDERIQSNEWTSSHIAEINQLRLLLLSIQPSIVKLRDKNW